MIDKLKSSKSIPDKIKRYCDESGSWKKPSEIRLNLMPNNRIGMTSGRESMATSPVCLSLYEAIAETRLRINDRPRAHNRKVFPNKKAFTSADPLKSICNKIKTRPAMINFK